MSETEIKNPHYLVLYDVMGIQNFIFSTNKLRDNLGSSTIVENILKEDLKNNVINSYDHLILDYKKYDNPSDFKLDDIEKDPIVIYIAGGNALLFFKDKERIKETTKKLTQQLVLKTGNLLSIAMACKKINPNDFLGDYDEIDRLIEKNKREKIQSMPLLGIAITKEEFSTGLPAQYCIKYADKPDLEYVSYSTILKRKSSYETTYEKKYLEDNEYIKDRKLKFKYKFPRNIDYLCQIEGQNDIAVIHIDGNDMGRKRKTFLEGKNYSQSLLKMNELSQKITNLFVETTKKTIYNIIEKLPKLKKEEIIDCVRKEKKKAINKINLPIRPLILNGDDITFISHGKLGIGFAEAFLKNLKKIQNDVEKKEDYQMDGKNLNFSGSAGVLIINTKFPFHRAYELSEALCKSAKTMGKAIEIKGKPGEAKKGNFIFTEGSWIDFHISHSTVNINLAETRNHRYNIIGKEVPDKLKVRYLRNQYEVTQYNLLWRPWCIPTTNGSFQFMNDHNWSDLLSLIERFKNKDNKWPKNKLIRFKKSFLETAERVDQFKLELERRELKIPEFSGSSNIWKDRKTPYFDALDLMDYYYQIY
ncbi:MAG: hypothetical protein BAJALOKI1v1_150017 [Promethearchaeota archaeon]|nr:MAG: hypothetical protein BAJALOKI1v1_150017 [Candidatus Lokiarchaeota archaeon]